MMSSLAQRRALLTAALGFTRLRLRDAEPSALAWLRCWLDSWNGVGAVIAGMHAQGYDVELKEFPSGWRANLSATGLAHSVVSGSAYELTAGAAV